jgi:hypothetical protein
MTGSFDFVSTEDKPALIAFSTPEWLEAAKTALKELGYKVHTAATHSDFLVRFSQVHYQVVIVEELFGANTIEKISRSRRCKPCPSTSAATRPFSARRSFQTFMPMEAFKHSVHAVINSSEMFLLKQLVEKAVADNNLFLHSFREVQNRVYTSANRL